MSSTQDMLVHTEAGVTTVTFNRADKKNSITEAMYAAMGDALAQAAQDAAVRCLVFQGDSTWRGRAPSSCAPTPST